MSGGFGKKKNKTSEQSSSRVEPWEYAEGALQNITDIAGQEYLENLNNQFLGGYNPDDVFTPYTDRQKRIMDMGADSYGMLDPTRFTDATARYNQIIQGQDTTPAGIAQRNFIEGRGTPYMQNIIAGGGRNAFNELGQSSEEFVKDLGQRVTNQITNQTALDFNKYGMFDPNSANFQRTVGTGVADNIADDLLAYYSADRGLQFDAIQDNITNQYNAGATAQDNMYNASAGAMGDQMQFISDMPSYQNQISSNYADALDRSLGYDQYGVDYQNALNQLGIAGAQYEQDKDMTALGDYYNMLMAIASGFPQQFTQGTRSGKSSGFNFGFDFS